MKKILILSILLFSSNAYAINLDDALNKLKEHSEKKIDNTKKEIKQNVENKSKADLLNKAEDKNKTNLLNKIKDYKDNPVNLENIIGDKLQKQADKVLEKVNKTIKEVEDIKEQAEGYITYAKDLKAKAEKYLAYWKIVALAVSSTLFVFFVLIIRIFFRIKNLYKFLENIRSYKDIEARVAKLEAVANVSQNPIVTDNEENSEDNLENLDVNNNDQMMQNETSEEIKDNDSNVTNNVNTNTNMEKDERE